MPKRWRATSLRPDQRVQGLFWERQLATTLVAPPGGMHKNPRGDIGESSTGLVAMP